MEFFSPGLSQKINPHTAVSEVLIEHAFGFQTSSAQGELQSQEVYIYNKKKKEIDFQMRLVDLNFSQYVKVKLRDKSYQHLGEHLKSFLDVEDLKAIIFAGGRKSASHHHATALLEADEKLLRQAFLITKSVPRKSNRSKWKENSGYAPNMLEDKDVDAGKLLVGDLVFCDDALDGTKPLIVQEEVQLDKISEQIVVRQIDGKDSECVLSSKLLEDRGLIFVVPSQMYNIVNNEIQLNDIASQMLEDCIINRQIGDLPYSDEEAAELTENGLENNEARGMANEEALDMANEDEDGDEPVRTGRKRKLIIHSDDEDGEISDHADEVVSDVVGQWVIAKFSFTKRDNFYLGQIIKVIDDSIEFQF